MAISNDGQFVSFADKFGVVWVVELEGFHEKSAMIDKKAAPILAHYCSIITSLVCDASCLICNRFTSLYIWACLGITASKFVSVLVISFIFCLLTESNGVDCVFAYSLPEIAMMWTS